MQAAYET